MPTEVPPDLVGQSSLYRSDDPLLKRLRLQDSTGRDIADIERYFRGKDTVVFYAGSEQGSQNLRPFHSELTRFTVRHLKTCAVIYVSTDTDPLAPERVLSGQTYARMVFADNSDFAGVAPPLAADPAAGGKVWRREVGVEDVKRGEDFVTAGEIEVGAEKVTLGEDENPHDYARPLSRAALTQLMRAYSTPSVAVYHIPSHDFIARNVRTTAFGADQAEKNYATWRNGGTPRLTLWDIIKPLKWALILLVLSVSYRLYLLVVGEQHNVIPVLLEKFQSQIRPV